MDLNESKNIVKGIINKYDLEDDEITAIRMVLDHCKSEGFKTPYTARKHVSAVVR